MIPTATAQATFSRLATSITGLSRRYFAKSDMVVNDKYSHDSIHYDLQRAPSGIDPEELRRLQHAAQSIIYLQLYRAGERRDVHSYYQMCHPEELRPDSEAYTDLFGDDELSPTYPLPQPWPAGEPFIGRVQNGAANVISHPSNDPHLSQIYVSLSYK